MLSIFGRPSLAFMLTVLILGFGAPVGAEMPPASDSYRFERSVVPGGGGAVAAPGSRLQQVVWQSTPVGTSTSASFNHLSGFLGTGNCLPAPLLNFMPGDSQGELVMTSFTRWIPDRGCQSVFNLAYDPRFFRIGTYDAANGWYVECGQQLPIVPGRAYWVLALNGLLVEYCGAAVRFSGHFDLELFFNPDDGRFPGGNGWNMVAPPDSSNYNLADLLVMVKEPDGSVVPGYPLALSNPDPRVDAVIDRRFWTWANGQYTVHHAIHSPTLLVVNSGGWMRAKAPGVFLRFPAGAGLSPTAVAGASWQRAALATAQDLTGIASAVADDGISPPLPLGDFAPDLPVTDTSGSGGGGCFIATSAGPTTMAAETIERTGLGKYPPLKLKALTILLGVALGGIGRKTRGSFSRATPRRVDGDPQESTYKTTISE